jgi:hypothetical protein
VEQMKISIVIVLKQRPHGVIDAEQQHSIKVVGSKNE